MTIPTTKDEFKSYVLRRLGEPIIKVDVTPEQLDDIIDFALEYYYEYHYAGHKKVYYAHQITDQNKIDGWFSVPDTIISITSLLRPQHYYMGTGMWNVQYQWAMNNWNSINNGHVQDYWFAMNRLEFIDQILNESIPIRFQKHENRVYVDTNWEDFQTGEYIVLEGYEKITPDLNPDIWKDQWLIRYVSALTKRQWGQNLKKFESVQLPGGVTLNGQQMYDEANDEVLNLETEMINTYSPPIGHVIG